MFLLVPAYPGSPGQKVVKRLCVCVCSVATYLRCGWVFQYDTRCYFNVRSKADISQLNLPYVTQYEFVANIPQSLSAKEF